MTKVRRSQKRVAASPVQTRMMTSMFDFSSEPVKTLKTKFIKRKMS